MSRRTRSQEGGRLPRPVDDLRPSVRPSVTWSVGRSFGRRSTAESFVFCPRRVTPPPVFLHPPFLLSRSFPYLFPFPFPLASASLTLSYSGSPHSLLAKHNGVYRQPGNVQPYTLVHYIMHVQGSAQRLQPGLMNFVTALAKQLLPEPACSIRATWPKPFSRILHACHFDVASRMS